tara:strand:+ start:482 stop:718 length:237 start_codon:yes stop_codon:yes gene_type:complete
MEGLIRKIVIGKDPKNGMAYYVGMKAGGGEVEAIVQDEKYLVKYGMTRYLVYVRDDNGTALWKAVDSMPCILEFDLKF